MQKNVIFIITEISVVKRAFLESREVFIVVKMYNKFLLISPEIILMLLSFKTTVFDVS